MKKRNQLQIYVDDDHIRIINQISKQTGQSKSSVVRQILLESPRFKTQLNEKEPRN